ncbi:ankyrin repeat-containing domain, PGG domain protein [Tanacetum coccineum]
MRGKAERKERIKYSEGMNELEEQDKKKKDKEQKEALLISGRETQRAVDAKKESLFGQIPRNSKNKSALDLLKYDSKPKFPYRFKQDYKNNEDWLDKKRNTLMVVASLIATMAFQAGTNPPSGVWQDNSTDHMAGYSIMEYNHQNLYHVFLVSNTLGFVSTLSIILLLISGLPFLRHRFFLWILMVIMWIATASMSLTYLVSISVLTPKPEAQMFKNVVSGIVMVWIWLMTLLVAGHTIQLRKILSNPPFTPV